MEVWWRFGLDDFPFQLSDSCIVPAVMILRGCFMQVFLISAIRRAIKRGNSSERSSSEISKSLAVGVFEMIACSKRAQDCGEDIRI